MQKTSFPVEIIVRDDASSDGTVDIVKSYEKRYPHLFRNIYETENQYSRGKKPLQSMWPKARGTYIAMCEGDDYWSDPLKLEKQVKVLEEHPEVVMCHHWHQHLCPMSGGQWELQNAPMLGHGYLPQPLSSVEDIFANRMRCKTRTMCFRNVYADDFYPEWISDVAFGDVPLTFLLGQYGKFYFIDEVMAVYRQTGQGLSSLWRDSSAYTVNHYLEWVKIWDYAVAHYSYRYAKIARIGALEFYRIIIRQSGFLDVLLFSRLFLHRMKRFKGNFAYDGWILLRLPLVFLADRCERLRKRLFSRNEKP